MTKLTVSKAGAGIQKAQVQSTGKESWTQLGPVFLLSILSAVFLRAINCGFVNFDDDLYVTDNLHVQQGLTWDGLRWAFTANVAANWHPLTWYSHMLDFQSFGLRPWGHHLLNALLHGANTALLYLLLKQMTAAVWRSFFVAALFAIHPLHVESVAWVSERKDVLSGLFFMLTLGAYVRYAAATSWQRSEAERLRFGANKEVWYGLAMLAFALGLMSKPMLVTTPFVLLLLDYWPLRRMAARKEFGSEQKKSHGSLTIGWMKLVGEKVPFFILAAASSVVTYVVQNRASAMWSFSAVPLWTRVENALVSYGRYLGKFVLPIRLTAFYPHPGEWSATSVLGAILLLLTITLAGLRLRRRAPYLLVGWCWFLGMLIPVIGLVQVGWQSLADRYMYLPMIGLLFAAVWGIEALTSKWMARPVPLFAIGTAVLLIGSVLAWRQIGFWKNSETLFRHALRVTEHNFVAHHNLGMALLGQGRFKEATAQFREALALRPNSADSYNGLGEALLAQNRLEEAMTLFSRAIDLKPDFAVAHNNLGMIFIRKNMPAQAQAEFQKALDARPGYVKALNNLGLVLQVNGELDEAILQLREAVRLAPGDAEVHKNLAMALGRKGSLDEAIAQLEMAIKINPNDSQTHHNLGLALTRKGRLAEAIAQLETSLKLEPDSADTHALLGMALAQAKRNPEAIEHLKLSLKMKPDNPQAEALLRSLNQ